MYNLYKIILNQTIASINTEKTVALILETGVVGGSVAVYRDDYELIDFWTGTQHNSRILEIFEGAGQLLAENKINKNTIGRIVVSKGPGSYTGIRNGWATALGLARSLRCAMVAVSVLEALTVSAANGPRGRILTAIPFGKTQICRQEFNAEKHASKIKNVCTPVVLQKKDFVKNVIARNPDRIVLHGSLFAEMMSEKYTEWSTEWSNEKCFINAGENMAILLGKYLKENPDLQKEQESGGEAVHPLYISESK